MKNWKTTVTGIGTFLVPLGNALSAQFDGVDSTVPNWGLVVSAAIALVALIAAKDPGK